MRKKKPQKSNLPSARGLGLFHSVGTDLWIPHGCAAALAAGPIISQLETAGTTSAPHCSPPYLPFLLTTCISGLFVAGFFMFSSPISSFSHQSLKHHTCTALVRQRWTLFRLLSLGCDLLPWPPPRKGHTETLSICDQVQCSCPLFSYYCHPLT